MALSKKAFFMLMIVFVSVGIGLPATSTTKSIQAASIPSAIVQSTLSDTSPQTANPCPTDTFIDVST